MSPDKKYMPTFRKSDDGDIKFQPFNSNIDGNSPFIGWIPILFYNSSTMNFPNANMGNNTLTNMVSPMPLNNFPMPNNNNSITNNIADLYSYNKKNKKNNDNSMMSRNSSFIPSDLLRDFDLDLDEDTDLARNCCNSDIDKIYNYIEENNSGTISLLQAYDIPLPIIKLIIKRVIKISINTSKEE